MAAPGAATSTAQKLAAMTQTIPFDEAFDAGRRIFEGKTRGRLVVTIG